LMISVVIPTHNHREFLARCLGALLSQDFEPSSYEVIVSDDGSSDKTPQLVSEFASRFEARGTRLVVVRNEHKGASAARNAGIRAATGEIVAFTDDDCLPDRRWLATISQHFDQHPEHLGVGGRTVSIPELVTPFTHQVENDLEYSFLTCNVAYKRNVLLRVGMFDETFPFPGCKTITRPDNEDWDIAFKVQSLGKIGFEPSMLVVHPPRPASFGKQLARIRNLESEFYLFERHPASYRASVHKHPLRVLLYHRALVQPALKIIRFWPLILRRPALFAAMLGALCIESISIWAITPYFLLRHIKRRGSVGPWTLEG